MIKGILAGLLLTASALALVPVQAACAGVAAESRLHFHDCFVQGCDGAVPLDSDFSERIG